MVVSKLIACRYGDSISILWGLPECMVGNTILFPTIDTNDVNIKPIRLWRNTARLFVIIRWMPSIAADFISKVDTKKARLDGFFMATTVGPHKIIYVNWLSASVGNTCLICNISKWLSTPNLLTIWSLWQWNIFRLTFIVLKLITITNHQHLFLIYNISSTILNKIWQKKYTSTNYYLT